MQIHFITIGQKMPRWVTEGYEEYARRLPAQCRLTLVELALPKRGKQANVTRLIQAEGEKMLAAIPKGAFVVALDERGKSWNTKQLAQEMDTWMHSGQAIALLVGGPDGLADACKARADKTWSLSALTLPHPLVRIVVAEQIYRAWTVLQGHPYHRE